MVKHLVDYLRSVKVNHDCGTYLAFTVFYAPHGIQLPEDSMSEGWYVMIDDPSPREGAPNGSFSDPLGPFDTPEEAIAQARDEGWVDGHIKDNAVQPDRLQLEWQ